MLRINSEKLNIKDGKYYFNNNVFEGIAFWVKCNGVIDPYYCQNGKKIRAYKSDFLSWDDNALLAHSSYLTEEKPDEYSAMLFTGEKFNGVEFSFDNDGMCCGETVYESGISVSCVEYAKKMSSTSSDDNSWYLFSVDVNDIDLSQFYQFREDSSLMTAEITQKNNFTFFLSLSEENQIQSLRLKGNPLAKLLNFKSRLKFSLPSSLEALKTLKISQKLSLSGASIDDEFFNSIFGKNGFEELVELRLLDTSLTSKSVEKLNKLQYLKTLNISPKLSI